MTKEEKIKTLESFCNKWKLCSGGCPIWKNTELDCNWATMSDDMLDRCIAIIDSYERKNRAIPASNTQFDMVSHPPHYNQGGIECIDAIKAATVNKIGIEAVCVANVIKYLFRYETKNGLEDVKKAAWYLNRLIKELENK